MEDLLHVVTPLMGKNGVAVLQNEIARNTVEDNMAAVTYEFIVIHESGEQLPPQRFTGMARFRDSKGNVDDKAINKAHTAARKYFLLSLFQVPSGDFDDSDGDEGEAPPRSRAPIPGPRQATAASAASPRQSVPGAATPNIKARAFASTFIQKLGEAKTPDDVARLEAANDIPLQKIFDEHRDVYDTVKAAVDRRLEDMTAGAKLGETAATPRGMPDPRVDPQLAVNWVAQNLNEMKTYDGALAFWETNVAANEKLFAPV